MKMRYYSHYKKWHNHNDPNYVDFMQRKFRNTFDDNLPQLRNAAILEIGCANGMALLTLKNMGYTNLLGIELDEELASIARSFDLNVANTDAIRFINETEEKYDFIYMFDVLEHFSPDIIPQFLQGVFNRLNVNGKLMLVVPNATSPAGSYFRYIDWTHQVSFTPTSISHLLEEAGFKEITIEDESLIPDPKAEDFNSERSYLDAKQRADKARFYESFARWQMKSMFGDNPLNLLVAPNMRIIAIKSDVHKGLRINSSAHQFFDLQDFIVNTRNLLLELDTSFNKEKNSNALENTKIHEQIAQIYTDQKIQNTFLNAINSEVGKVKDVVDNINIDLYNQTLKFERKFDDYNHLLEDIRTKYDELTEVVDEISNMALSLDSKKISRNEFIDIYKRLILKKRKKLFGKLVYRLRAHRQRPLIKDSNLFDEDYYLNNNPDVKQSRLDPIIHYLMYGAYENRNPSPNFNTDEYYLSNIEALIYEINPIIHAQKKALIQ